MEKKFFIQALSAGLISMMISPTLLAAEHTLTLKIANSLVEKGIQFDITKETQNISYPDAETAVIQIPTEDRRIVNNFKAEMPIQKKSNGTVLCTINYTVTGENSGDSSTLYLNGKFDKTSSPCQELEKAFNYSLSIPFSGGEDFKPKPSQTVTIGQ